MVITDFEAHHIEQAARLLAARQRTHRAAEPLLSPRFEDETIARGEIAPLWERPGASGAVALADGRVVGYLLGVPRAPDAWGPNIWVEAAGHAVGDPEVARDLYAHAAARWVANGRTAHYVLVPATDLPLVDAWFRLGFGQQHVHAVREVPSSFPPEPPGTSIRPATRADVELLAELDLLLPEHQRGSPVFSAGPPTTYEDARAEWEQSLEDPAYPAFVAERHGRVVGSAVGCPVALSSAHSGVARPDGAAILAFAAVRPEARGGGIGRALGWRVLRWAGEAGYACVVTDWRSTNLLASRAWPRLGFRPTFLRLFRRI